MILKKISDTSIIISLFRYLFRWYGRIEQKLTYIYHNSQTHELTMGLWEKIKIYFRYSFFGRITESKKTAPRVLDTSRTLRYLINLYKRWKNKSAQFFKTSSTVDLAKNTKKQLNFSPVKIISMIVIISIAVNVFLSLVLQKQISLWGWLMRGLFLFGAFSGLLCKADWVAVKSNSIILRKLGNN